MNSIDYIMNIMEIKKKHPHANFYRELRYISDIQQRREILKIVKDNEFSNKGMQREYFPPRATHIYQRKVQYEPRKDNSISELLNWGLLLIERYVIEINRYTELKQKYEDAFFKAEYVKAGRILSDIEGDISFSTWGIYQRFLLLNLKNEQDEVKDIISRIETNAEYNSLATVLVYYYAKMTDYTIDLKKYMENINSLLSTVESNKVVLRYLKYKLDILAEKGLHEMKVALVIDEQSSLIDYYETYIEVLQYLSLQTNKVPTVANIITSLKKINNDYRIRNLYIALVDSEMKVEIDPLICGIIEEYTCGNYSSMEYELKTKRQLIQKDFVMCNLCVKVGIRISDKQVAFQELWKEVEKIYGYTFDLNNSIEVVGRYYKTLYGTAWRYKVLGILIRKLNYKYYAKALELSILNDKQLTPLFYQVVLCDENKKKYLSKFSEWAPITMQLHKYMITGEISEEARKKIWEPRWKYYEIKKLADNTQYIEGIKKCNDLLKEFSRKDVDFYQQERIRRILFKCYMSIRQYIKAMELFVESYTIMKDKIVNMELSILVCEIEKMAEKDTLLHENICRPILLRMFYKNDDEMIISSYLDYLESQGCKTINELLEKKTTLNLYDSIFLEEVCTQNLLMKDYVSKAKNKDSAAKLRARVLKRLLRDDLGHQKEYVSELGHIYKATLLQDKIDFFNHNRIFIDKDNLLRFLKDEINQEFAKFNSVQAIRDLISDSNDVIKNIKLGIENYLDQTRFLYDMTEKIKRAYLNDSPYSLENFLSTRIRHNYCNDKLKRVFEEQKIFSKKVSDDSDEYIVNDYWQDILEEEEYNRVIVALSEFSKAIDMKIQEIKTRWIRIKKEEGNDGLFDYDKFSGDFMNYNPINSENIVNNSEYFIHEVIEALDMRTNAILGKVRNTINNILKPYYSDALLALENKVKIIEFSGKYKSEMIRKIETTKAKYVEDIEEFKDIFNMENEKYPNFTFDELLEFCCEVEADMSGEFSQANLEICVNNYDKYSGDIFTFLVDIMGILIRNAVQHSGIKEMKNLDIAIKIGPFLGSEMEKNVNERRSEYDTVINVSNNLSSQADEEEINHKVAIKLKNIIGRKYNEESNKEGGTGLYKIARTVDYNLHSAADLYQVIENGIFDIHLALNLQKYICEVKE